MEVEVRVAAIKRPRISQPSFPSVRTRRSLLQRTNDTLSSDLSLRKASLRSPYYGHNGEEIPRARVGSLSTKMTAHPPVGVVEL